jgi:GNAT superfamily N-acetyltransferase
MTLDLVARPDPDSYRALFRAVGSDGWLWCSRLLLGTEALTAILHDPAVEVMVLRDGAREVGLLELDFREKDACELAFLGLVPDVLGRGAGRYLMNIALTRAWAQPISRLHVHTCTFDHPDAVAFYQRSGFRPTRRQVEVFDDPRLTGVLPRWAAPHIPIIEG